MLTPLPRRRGQALATLGMFWLGVMAPDAMTGEHFDVHLGVASLATCAFALTSLPSTRSTAQVVRFLACGATVGCFAAGAAFSVLLGVMLAWTVPTWGVVLVVAVSILGFATAAPSWQGIRLPAVLALGLWIALCLNGWHREDGIVRCDDFLRTVAQPRVEVVLPTTLDASACTPGEALRVGRYPRRVWEAPEEGRFVVTTQDAVDMPADIPAPAFRLNPAVDNLLDVFGDTIEAATTLTMAYVKSRPGRAVANRLPGAVCEVWADRTKAPRCFQNGADRKAQAILESDSLDRLFVVGYDRYDSSRPKGILAEFTRSEPLELLTEHPMWYSTSEGYYDPHSDVIGLFDKEATQVDLVRASGFAQAATPVLLPAGLGESHYDPVHGEGIICFANGPLALRTGQAFLAVAFRGFPFSYHWLGSSSTSLATASFVHGCDFDAETRRAYVASATTGLLATIDYDSGEVLRWMFVGFATRSMVLDKARHRLYRISFPSGDLTAVDVDTGSTVAGWFVGRFARTVSLSRDRRFILVTSSLGVVRVSIEGNNLRGDGAPLQSS